MQKTKLWAGLLGLLFWVSAQAAPQVRSGYYGPMMLGVENEAHISGYFYDALGWDNDTKKPRFVCAFFFQATLNKGTKDYQVDSWSPDGKVHIPGRLSKSGSEVELYLSKHHGGCGNVRHFTIKDSPASFKLTETAPWLSVRGVKASKAHFYSKPHPKSRVASYLIQGDPVQVLKRKGKWVYVEYIGTSGITTGWVNATDLY